MCHTNRETIQNQKTMQTLFQTANKEYFIEFNGSTFFVMDSADQCRLATSSRIKAKNTMNRILNGAGINEQVTKEDLQTP